MMIVHYIWIGADEVPIPYLNNFRKCVALNPSFQFQIWKNQDCTNLLNEHELLEYWSSLTFACKCNLLKYLVLHKFGGIYTDFDIKWKIPFIKILNDFDLGYHDLILTILDNNPIQVNGKLVELMDDPFIVSKPNILGGCINYCRNRTDLKYDGEIYKNIQELRIHKTEPIGPFGLTEWLYKNNIRFAGFHQMTLLDHSGYFGEHEQRMNWKNI